MTETTKLIAACCDSDFHGTIKRTNSAKETGIHQAKATYLSQQTLLEPTSETRSSSFWVADAYAQLHEAVVSSQSDDDEPYITGMTFLKDSQLVACDKNNMSVKLFDRDLGMVYDVGSLTKPRNCTFFKKSFFHMARFKTFKFSL